MPSPIPLILAVVAAVIAFTVGAMIAARRGYKQSGELVVRCREGHLFTTSWNEFTVRRLDLGFARIQRCPVDGRLTLVRPVDQSQLTSQEKKQAKQHRDVVPRRQRRGHDR